MDLPGLRLQQLKGTLKGRWSVAISGNWRITFAFDGKDAVLVDYEDYHWMLPRHLGTIFGRRKSEGSRCESLG